MMDELTYLEDAWLIWSGETGVDMDEAFSDFSTPQQWCDAGIFPGDHELLILQGYAPQDVRCVGRPPCRQLFTSVARDAAVAIDQGNRFYPWLDEGLRSHVENLDQYLYQPTPEVWPNDLVR